MASGDFTVSFVTSSAQISPDLWDRCFPPPLEGRWWYETLERSGLENQFTFFYGVIARHGEPCGIAPAFLMDVPIELVVPPEIMPAFKVLGKILPSSKYQRSLFVGSPCADEGTVGLVPGVDRRAVFSRLQSALEEKARKLNVSMLIWKDFPDEYADDLDVLAKQRGMFKVVSYPGAILRLPSSRKEDLFAAMKRSRRQKIKHKLKLSLKAAELTGEVIRRPPPEALDEMFSLFLQTYHKSEIKFEKLGRKFFEAIAECEPAHFLILREKATGKMVAFRLFFAFRDRVIDKFIGLDYSRPKEWFLLFRLWDATVDCALLHGVSSIQSGQTGYSAKIELGYDLVPLTNYCRHRNRLIHAIYAFVARSIDWHTLDEDLAVYVKAYPGAREGCRKPQAPASLKTPFADEAAALAMCGDGKSVSIQNSAGAMADPAITKETGRCNSTMPGA
jgi:predicted N-acyltransferase